LDLLASQFEDIRMTDDEKIGDFSAKLSSIANESQVLGKKYEDAKLVKKFCDVCQLSLQHIKQQ